MQGAGVQGAGCRVQGCRVQGAGCRVQGAGCRVQGAGCRVVGVDHNPPQSSGYRVVLILGKMRPQYSYPHSKKCATPIMGFIGLAIALPPPSVHEVHNPLHIITKNFDVLPL